ncbi:MAG: hypothetical protein KC479_15210, partial [Dehalococcoidia bacterium]|nr:hypothetical protein [Dehalococcoidia bacterium]
SENTAAICCPPPAHSLRTLAAKLIYLRTGYSTDVPDSNTGADAVAPDPVAVCRPQTRHDATSAQPFMLFVTIPVCSKGLAGE